MWLTANETECIRGKIEDDYGDDDDMEETNQTQKQFAAFDDGDLCYTFIVVIYSAYLLCHWRRRGSSYREERGITRLTKTSVTWAGLHVLNVSNAVNANTYAYYFTCRCSSRISFYTLDCHFHSFLLAFLFRCNLRKLDHFLFLSLVERSFWERVAIREKRRWYGENYLLVSPYCFSHSAD